MTMESNENKPDGLASHAHYKNLSCEFMKYHRNHVNVAIHLITSPLGLIGAICIVNSLFSSTIGLCLSLFYIIALCNDVPMNIFVPTAVLTICLYILSITEVFASLSIWQNVFLIAFATIFQELGHLLTSEKTFQSTYIGTKNAMNLLIEHTYFLLPLVLESVLHMDGSFATLLISWDRIVTSKFEEGTPEKEALNSIKTWVLAQNPPAEHTTHFWFSRLSSDVKSFFASVANSETVKSAFSHKFDPNIYQIEAIEAMNEIYVASQYFDTNSDKVFHMEHVDGPWGIFPFASVFRCMVAVNEQDKIVTSFPLRSKNEKRDFLLSDGDFVAFDFNREIHYISNKHLDDRKHRICLKLHYAVYPKYLMPIGMLLTYLTASYNFFARNLFLMTIDPKDAHAKLQAQQILFTTWATAEFQKHIGLTNFGFVVAISMFSFFIGSHWPLTITTSYFHYAMYMATYYHRKNLAYPLFLRDVIFFKAISVIHLVFHYFYNFQFDMLSILMIIGGYALAASAALALGKEKTYFGIELGFCKPVWINAFPYNSIPHPMIFGAIIALLGYYKMDSFRTAMPLLVPGHILLYVMHCAQEAYDIHDVKSKGMLSPYLEKPKAQ